MIADTQKSTAEWFGMAKNVVEYANADGLYDALEAYMRQSGKRSNGWGFYSTPIPI